MGHEIAGYVDDIGSESNAEKLGFKKGDRVAVFPWQGCQKCGACQINTPNFCPRDDLLLFFLGLVLSFNQIYYTKLRLESCSSNCYYSISVVSQYTQWTQNCHPHF